jgi:hypothetical protein
MESESLTELRAQLPRAWRAKIAKRVGCDPSYVGNILNGYTPRDGEKYRNVLNAAKQLAAEHQAAIKAV